MAEIECLSCSAPVPLAAGRPGARVVVTCDYCGSSHPVTVPTGLETVAIPRARSPRPAPAPPVVDSPFADFPIPSGTALLIPEQKRRDATRSGRPRTVRRASLVVEGAGRASMPLAGARTEVGRKAAHIVIADPALSAVHFVVEAIGETYVIRDLDSSNGTRLNGHPVRSARLEPGDLIDAGQTRFCFRVEESIPWDRG